MVYVSSDGQVHQNRPWGLGRITDLFWGAIEFVTLFFKTLIPLDRVSIGGSRGSGGGSGPGGPGGGGPPRGPKRMGGITTIQDCSMPGGG